MIESTAVWRKGDVQYNFEEVATGRLGPVGIGLLGLSQKVSSKQLRGMSLQKLPLVPS